MTDCERLKEHYESYALGALEGEERAELKAHLVRVCPTCAPEVERARWLVAQLAYLAPEAEPPAALREKLMEAVSGPKPHERRPRIPFWAWAGAAALVLFTVYSLWETRRLGRELSELQRQTQTERSRNQALHADRQVYQSALAILSAPGTREANLKASAASPGSRSLPEVRAYWNARLGLLLAARRMPAPPADRTFQLWAVPKKGNPISAGIFRPDAGGTVLFVTLPEAQIAETAALAISEEPAGGRPQPTKDKILWVGPLS